MSRPIRVSISPGRILRALAFAAVWAVLLLLPDSARASFLSPEMEDKMADWLTIFVLVVIPIGGIILFWLLHILPEQIAHKRHHPQFEAIRTLCLLSLVFGGMLWPFAWIWAYTKPVVYKMAYGDDKHPDAYEDDATTDVAPAPVKPATAPSPAKAAGTPGSTLGLSQGGPEKH